jgi:hypothetical protein
MASCRHGRPLQEEVSTSVWHRDRGAETGQPAAGECPPARENPGGTKARIKKSGGTRSFAPPGWMPIDRIWLVNRSYSLTCGGTPRTAGKILKIGSYGRRIARQPPAAPETRSDISSAGEHDGQHDGPMQVDQCRPVSLRPNPPPRNGPLFFAESRRYASALSCFEFKMAGIFGIREIREISETSVRRCRAPAAVAARRPSLRGGRDSVAGC